MKKLIVVLLSLAFAFGLTAAPSIISFSLRSGTNLPRINGEIVRGNYSLVNPDDTPYDLTIQVIPEGGSGGALYYRRILLPPHSSFEGFIPLVFTSANSYVYRLIEHRGGTEVEIMHGDIPIAISNPAGSASPGLMGEENRLAAADYLYVGNLRTSKTVSNSLPALNRSRGIDNAARFVSFSSGSTNAPPASLAEFSRLGAVLLGDEKYQNLTALQFNALRDYVRGGGYLIVTGPIATQMLYDSPLRPMLPVAPAGVRSMEDGGALRKAWGLAPREYQLRDQNGDLVEVPGYDFCEALLLPGAKVLRSLDGLPMMAIRSYGLGTVLWLAFDPVGFTSNEPEIREQLWNGLLRPANFMAESLRPDSQLLLEEIQQQLLGYSIPPFRTLGIYLAAYVLCAIILLLACTRAKHPAIGWGLVCLLGIGFTLAIVTHAHNLSANQPQRQLNRIALRVWDGAPGPQTTFANLTCRDDITLDLAIDNATGFLFPSPAKTSVESSETALERARLLVGTNANQTSLMRLTLQENRPRAANWIQASSQLETPLGTSLPVLRVAPDGALELPEWTVPEELRPFNRALLLLPGAIQTLNSSGSQLTGIARDAVENDTVLVQVREYLAARQLRSPAVCLVSIARSAEVAPDVQIQSAAGGFQTYDYTLTVIPATLEWPAEGETFTIPAELTWMAVDNNSYLASAWAFGECTGLSFTATIANAGSSAAPNARRSRIAVPVCLPPTAPAGELLRADVQYSLLENSTYMDVQPRIYRDDADMEGIAPVTATAQGCRFADEAHFAYDPGRARFTVHFLPVPTSSQPSADQETGNTSSREATWWLYDVHAALVFRRTPSSVQ